MAVQAVTSLTLYNGIYPILFNLYLLRAGYGPEFVGTANAVAMLSRALSALPAGALADRLGVRRVMLASLALSAAAHGILPWLEFAPARWQGIGVLVAYGLGALGGSAYSVNSTPLLMNISKPSLRNLAFSVRVTMFPLAGFAGSLLGGLLPGWIATPLGVTLNHPAPYRYPLFLAALLCLPALPLLRRLDADEARAAQERALDAKSPLPWQLFAIMILIGILRPAALGVVRPFFNMYLDDGLGVPTAQIGMLYSGVQLLSTPAPLLMPWLADHLGLKNTLILCSAGVAGGAALMGLAPHWAAATLARFIVACLSSINFAALGVFQMELVSSRWRATMSGSVTMAMGLSWSALSLGGGYMIADLGYRAFFLTGVTLTLVGVAILAAYFRVPRGEYEKTDI